VGKTTTKEFIATVLEGKFRVGKTPGNANSQVGMPLSLLNARGDEEVFVMEMGMSQPGELKRLVAVSPPTIAVIIAVELCHALYFQDGLEGIARAKAEILSSPETQCAILHASLLLFPCMQREGVVSYGAPGADFELEHNVVIERGERSPPLEIPFSETHLCSNALAAIAVARELKMSWEEIQTRVALLRPFPKRFERLEVQGRVVINDAYNASPASMRAALCNLPDPQKGKKRVAVLGSMKELGRYTEGCHREVALAALLVIDHLLCLGEECAPMVDVFKQENRPVELFSDLAALKRRVFAVAEEGDVVLIKGSNSHRLWQIID
jgi:UDP-N-acetylmuramoyl-tripeptide--D-alanyl-D-alanine ligase